MSVLKRCGLLFVLVGGTFLLYQNCSPGMGGSGGSDSAVSTAAPSSSQVSIQQTAAVTVPTNLFTYTSATSFTNFANYCAIYSLASAAQITATEMGNCPAPGNHPLILGVTQESVANSRAGSKNASAPSGTDFLLSDLGTWFNKGFYPTANGNDVGIVLDTINFNKINPVTGWSLQAGHLFYGVSDNSMSLFGLDKTTFVEFDIRIRGDQVENTYTNYFSSAEASALSFFPNGYTGGHHITVGVAVLWDEPGAAQKAHFFETVLMETPNYHNTYGDPSSSQAPCQDVAYDRCFLGGVEGRYVNYVTYLHNAALPLNTDQWTHVRIPLSQVIRSLSWQSPPANYDWSKAQYNGLYIAVESMGADRAWFEVQNYQAYNMDSKPSPLGVPLGLIRLGVGGVISTGAGICMLPNGQQLGNYGWTYDEYVRAPQITQAQIPTGYQIPSCPTVNTPYTRGLFRIGNSGVFVRGQFYCGIPSGQVLAEMGYTGTDFNNAPQLYAPAYNLIYTGACW